MSHVKHYLTKTITTVWYFGTEKPIHLVHADSFHVQPQES